MVHPSPLCVGREGVVCLVCQSTAILIQSENIKIKMSYLLSIINIIIFIITVSLIGKFCQMASILTNQSPCYKPPHVVRNVNVEL